MNEELIRATADKLRTVGPAWDQQWFVSTCGTTHCFAGWALRLSGWGIVEEQTVLGKRWFMQSPDGERQESGAMYAAAELMELDRETAFDIFFHIEPGEDVEEYLAFVGRTLGLQDL